MTTVIGLGTAGSRTAEAFRKYSYDVRKISVDSDESTTYRFPQVKTYEEAEQNCPDFDFTDIDDSVLLVMAGASILAGASARILQQLVSGRRVEILFIKSNQLFLDKLEQDFERVCFQILQEKARSGAIEQLTVVHNASVEVFLGEILLEDYWTQINTAIVDMYHSLEYYAHAKPVFSNLKKRAEISRISTIGFINFETLEELPLYPLQYIKEKEIHYIIDENVIKTDKTLIAKLNKQAQSLKKTDTEKVSYAVHKAAFNGINVFCRYSTDFIQESAYLTQF